MTVGDVLAHVKEVKPNPFSDDVLVGWINDIEAKVETEVLKKKAEGAKVFTLPKDIGTELYLPKPYDEVYKLYVQAQIDFALQEFDTYNNTMVMFNAAYTECKRHYVEIFESRHPLKIRVSL